MKSVKTSKMRKVNGGCLVQCEGCGKKGIVIGPLTMWIFASRHMSCNSIPR